MIPAPLPARTLDQLEEVIGRDLAGADGQPDRKRDPAKVLAFFSMVDRRRKLHGQVIGELTADRPEVLPIEVPAAAVLEQMGVRRAPIRGLRSPKSCGSRLPCALGGGPGEGLRSGLPGLTPAGAG